MERGLLNPGPPARPPVRPSAQFARLQLFRPQPPSPPSLPDCSSSAPNRPVRPSARPPSPLDRGSSAPDRPVRPSAHSCVLGPVRASFARPRVRASWAPSACLLDCLHPFRPRPPNHPRPFCLVRPSARPPVRRTASSAPVRPSALCTHRPPRPFRPRETVAAIYTPSYLPSDHPALRSPHWAPSLCCAFKDCGTTRGSRTLGGWSKLRGKPLQFFFAQQAAWRGKAFTSRETRLQQQLRVQD